jgi:SAM-dependent methyltransferase
MAALARRATRGMPVQIKETAFEEWRGEAGSFDLVFSAQAWHWIDRDRGHAVARHALRPGGLVALWWNDVDDCEPPMQAALDATYQLHAPELPDPVSTGAFQAQALESLARHGFEPMKPRTYGWTRPYDAVSFSELLRTNSDHRLLPPERLDKLLLAVAAAIEDVGGGEIICRYRTDLLTARRSGNPDEEPASAKVDHPGRL